MNGFTIHHMEVALEPGVRESPAFGFLYRHLILAESGSLAEKAPGVEKTSKSERGYRLLC